MGRRGWGGGGRQNAGGDGAFVGRLAADLGDLSGVITLVFSIPQHPSVSKKAQEANKRLLSFPVLLFYLKKKRINYGWKTIMTSPRIQQEVVHLK